MRSRLFTLRVPPSASEFHRKTHTQLPDKDRGRKSHSSVLWWGGFPPTTLTANWMPVSLHQRPASQHTEPLADQLWKPHKHINWKRQKERRMSRRTLTEWPCPVSWIHPPHLLKDQRVQKKKKKKAHTLANEVTEIVLEVKMWKSWTEFSSGMFWMMCLGSSGSGNLDLGCLWGSGVAMFQVWPAPRRLLWWPLHFSGVAG